MLNFCYNNSKHSPISEAEMNIKKTDGIYLIAVLCALLLLIHANSKLAGIYELLIYILIYSTCILLSFLYHNTSSIEVKKAISIPSHFVLLFSGSYTALTVMNICVSVLFPNSQVIIDYSLHAIIFSGIVVPIFEEIFWRGCLCSSLLPLGTVTAIITPSIMFGLLHRGTAGLITATFAGLLFSYLYILTDSLIPSIIIHVLNNTIGILSVKYPIYSLIFILFNIVIFISVILYYKITNTQKLKLKFSFKRVTLKSPYMYLSLLLFIFLRIAGGLQ